jgi:hypothetical protein
MLLAALVTQLRVLLEPDLMLCGFAANDVTLGAEPVTGIVVVGSGLLVEPPQPVRPMGPSRTRMPTHKASPETLRAQLTSRLTETIGEPKRKPSVAISFIVIAPPRSPQGGMAESRNASRILSN